MEASSSSEPSAYSSSSSSKLPDFLREYQEGSGKFKAMMLDARTSMQNEVNAVVEQKSRTMERLKGVNRIGISAIHSNSFHEAAEVWGESVWNQMSLGMTRPIKLQQQPDPSSTQHVDELYRQLIHADPAALADVHDSPREGVMYCAVSYKHLPLGTRERETHNQKMTLTAWRRLVHTVLRFALAMRGANQVVLWVDMALYTRKLSQGQDISEEEWMTKGLVPYFVLPVVVAREAEDFDDPEAINPRDMDKRMWLHVEQRAGGLNGGLCLAGTERWSFQDAMDALPDHLLVGTNRITQDIWRQSSFLVGRQTGMLQSMHSLIVDAIDGRVWERKVSWKQAMVLIVQWLIDNSIQSENVNDSSIFTEVADEQYEIHTSTCGAQKLWRAHWTGSAAEIHERNMIEFQESWCSAEVEASSNNGWNSLEAWMPGVRVRRLLEEAIPPLSVQMSYHNHEAQTRWLIVAVKGSSVSLGLAMTRGALDVYPAILVAQVHHDDDGDRRIGEAISWQKCYPKHVKFTEVIHTRLWVYTRSPTSSLRNSHSRLREQLTLNAHTSEDLKMILTSAYYQSTLGKKWIESSIDESAPIHVTALLGSEILWT